MADENKTERVQLLMTPSEVKAIDDWSFENRIRGRAEAMRRLCVIGLDAHQRVDDAREQCKSVFWTFSASFRAIHKLIPADQNGLEILKKSGEQMDAIVDLLQELSTMQNSYTMVSSEEIEPDIMKARKEIEEFFTEGEKRRRSQIDSESVESDT